VGTEREVDCTEALLNLAAADGVVMLRVAAGRGLAGREQSEQAPQDRRPRGRTGLAQAASERGITRRVEVDRHDRVRERGQRDRVEFQVEQRPIRAGQGNVLETEIGRTGRHPQDECHQRGRYEHEEGAFQEARHPRFLPSQR